MGQYFCGWRRKLGLVTLAIACIIVVAWVRSLTTEDNIYRYTVVGSLTVLELQSTHGYFFRWTSSKSYFPANSSRIFWSPSRVQASRFKIHSDENRAHWLLQQVGFEIGSMGSFGMDREVWCIPYWPIVASFTALSAWLLLSRRRQPNAIQVPVDQAT